MTTVQINLPDALAREAERAGLLAPEVFANWLREQLRTKSADELFATIERMNALPDRGAMSLEEVADEIRKIRSERRA
ncbi:MAG: hypothetical protein WBX09_13605 [Terracidiphilus sp.]